MKRKKARPKPRRRPGLRGMNDCARGQPPARAERYARVARDINQAVTGYVVGNLLTSLVAGVVVFADLAVLGVPFPLLWSLWVALVEVTAKEIWRATA